MHLDRGNRECVYDNPVKMLTVQSYDTSHKHDSLLCSVVVFGSLDCDMIIIINNIETIFSTNFTNFDNQLFKSQRSWKLNSCDLHIRYGMRADTPVNHSSIATNRAVVASHDMYT